MQWITSAFVTVCGIGAVSSFMAAFLAMVAFDVGDPRKPEPVHIALGCVIAGMIFLGLIILVLQ
jgi:RsiW-degrading membrane proteinase PrsW (M82 family)